MTKASPLELMKNWFDVHGYSGFWMTWTLMIRLPSHLFDGEAAEPYLSEWIFEIKAVGDYVVLTFTVDEMEIDPEDDGSGWMDRCALSPVFSVSIGICWMPLPRARMVPNPIR